MAQMVKDDWAVVKGDFGLHGARIYQELFKAAPQYTKLFHFLGDADANVLHATAPSDLPDALKAQALKTMNRLDIIIGHLGNDQALIDSLKALGRSHRRYKLDRSHFDTLSGVMLAYLGETLALDKAHADAWRATLQVVVDTVVGELEAQ